MFENMFLGMGAGEAPPGQQLFESSGTFTVPSGVFSICAVLIGAGGMSSPSIERGGGGGAMAYFNALEVAPGQEISIGVDPGKGSPNQTFLELSDGRRIQASRPNAQQGASPETSGGWDHPYVGHSGGDGSNVQDGGGGAAAGYSADGPAGNTSSGVTGSGGSGGSGGYRRGGGGVGPYGQGANGAAHGGGGSGGESTSGRNGGKYGGGAGHNISSNGNGGGGCVRIIWGAGRAFPSTNTQDM